MIFTKLRAILVMTSLLTFSDAFSQKSVGIGTLAPNTNAILDLVADGSRPQGFLPPRLSTAQMTTLGSVLTSPTDDGMLAFDSDLGILYNWKNNAWAPVSSDAGGTDAKSLQGNPVAVTAPVAGQSLVWNGSEWTPITIGVGPVLVTSFYTIPAASFDTQTDGNETIFAIDGSDISLKSQGSMYAPINLPHNATITGISVYVNDSDPVGDISMLVYRQNLNNDLLQVVASGASSGSLGKRTYDLTLDVAHVLIENNIFSYYFKIEMERDLFIRGVKISYTE